MSGNSQPRFTKNGKIGSVAITAANTSSEGGGTIGTDIFKAFTADANNGSFVEKVRLMATATAPTAMNPTVARIFVSSIAAGGTTSADTHLVAEVTLPNVNADNASAAGQPLDTPLGFTLPAGWTILVTNHAAPSGNTQWIATVFAGDY